MNEQSDYVKVEGLDAESVKLLRELEAKAAAKTASDYAHVVWAYGSLWVLFALYGVFLWRKHQGLRREIAEFREP